MKKRKIIDFIILRVKIVNIYATQALNFEIKECLNTLFYSHSNNMGKCTSPVSFFHLNAFAMKNMTNMNSLGSNTSSSKNVCLTSKS